MFMLQAVVLLMEADHVLEQHWIALGVGAVAVEILDVAEAVAAKGQLVGCDAEADVANVECLFAVEGGAGVYGC